MMIHGYLFWILRMRKYWFAFPGPEQRNLEWWETWFHCTFRNTFPNNIGTALIRFKRSFNSLHRMTSNQQITFQHLVIQVICHWYYHKTYMWSRYRTTWGIMQCWHCYHFLPECLGFKWIPRYLEKVAGCSPFTSTGKMVIKSMVVSGSLKRF